MRYLGTRAVSQTSGYGDLFGLEAGGCRTSPWLYRLYYGAKDRRKRNDTAPETNDITVRDASILDCKTGLTVFY